MKRSIIIILFPIVIYSQDFNSKDWLLFKNEEVQEHKVTESIEFKIDSFTFQIIWDSKLSYAENLGYYGGISSMKILNNGELINTFNDIEDGIALGDILFRFYDYNFDGYLDFTIPKSCGKSCFERYYLYNSEENKFKHYNKWDYLRIQKINKKKKQILEQPNGTATDGWQTLYQIKGNELIELEKKIYGSFFK